MSESEYWLKEEASFKQLGLELDNKNSSSGPSGNTSMLDSMTSFSDQAVQKANPFSSEVPECEAVIEWKKKRMEDLRMLDAQQMEKEAEMKEIAAKELENFKKTREEKIKESSRDSNPDDSQNIWESVLKYCESGGKYDKCSKDTSRFLSAIVRMKEKTAASR